MYGFDLAGQFIFAAAPAFDTVDLKNASAGAVRMAAIVRSPWHSEAITHVGYRQGTTTGSPASNSMTVSIQGVDGSGNPDGTDVGSTATTFTPSSANDGKTVWVTLANSYSPTRNTAFSVVFQNAADTSSNGITMAYRVSEAVLSGMTLPYTSTYAASTWTKSSSSFRIPVFGVRTASARYGLLFESAPDRTVTTSGHRSAACFTVSTSRCATYSISNIIGKIRSGSAGTHKIGIWNAAGTLLAGGTALDDDISRSTGATSPRQSFFEDTTLPTLTAGTKYYIGAEHNGGTVGMNVIALTSADDRLMMSPFLDSICYASWNGSAWTETTTDVPIVVLGLSDLTFSGGGGGGGAFPANLSGGIFQ